MATDRLLGLLMRVKRLLRQRGERTLRRGTRSIGSRVERVFYADEIGRRYRLLPEGYRLCVVFLTLFERIYAPLTTGLLQPVRGDTRIQDAKRHQLDRLLVAVGLKVAA